MATNREVIEGCCKMVDQVKRDSVDGNLHADDAHLLLSFITASAVVAIGRALVGLDGESDDDGMPPDPFTGP